MSGAHSVRAWAQTQKKSISFVKWNQVGSYKKRNFFKKSFGAISHVIGTSL